MQPRGALRLLLLSMALLGLLAGCGWVDSGVGGNEPPVTNKTQDAYAVTAGGVLQVDAAHGVLANDSDGGNTGLTARLAPGGSPQHAAKFTFHDDGAFTYVHDGSHTAADQFTYVANDGIADSPVTKVLISVEQPPTGGDDVYDRSLGQTLQVDAAHGVLANDSDLNQGDHLSATLLQQAEFGTVELSADGAFTYRSADNTPSADRFTYTVSDGQLTAEATARIRIRPQAADDSAQTPDGQPVTVAVLANDRDPDGALVATGVAVVQAPSHGSAAPRDDGRITYSPDKGFTGTDRFQYTVVDNDGATSNAATVTVAVLANRRPIANDTSISTDQDSPKSGTVTASDPNGNPLSFSVASNPAHGSLSMQADGRFTYTPAPGYSGSDSFTFQVSDGRGGTATGTVSIRIAKANSPPAADNLDLTTAEGSSTPGTVTASDPDGDPLSFAVATAPSHGSVSMHPDGTFVYAPAAGYAGTDSFTFRVSDGRDGSDTGTVSIRIARVNSPPRASNSTLTIEQDAAKSGKLSASDPDGDRLSFALASGPAHGSADVNSNGDFTYTPASGYAGPDGFSFSVADGKGGTDTGTVSITVTSSNTAPTADDLNITTEQDTAKTGKLSASDPDGDRLSFALASGPAHGSADVNSNGDFTYTPASGYAGPDGFNFSVADGKGGTDTGTVSITVTSSNTAPTADDLNITTEQDAAKTGKLSASDPDGDPLSFALASGPAHGSADVKSNGDFTYTPASGYAGPDGFNFSVADGKGGTDTGTVSITVTSSNTAPTADDLNITTEQDTAKGGKLNASDPDGDPLSFALASGPAHGSADVNSNGDFTYTPASGYAGPDGFSFSVADGKGGTDTGTVSITVTSSNTAPTADDLNITTEQDTAKTGKLSASDPDGDRLSFALASGPAHGSADVKSNGDFTYTPASGYAGPDGFSFSVADGKGGTDTGTVSITVTSSNTAPTADDLNITTEQDTSVSNTATGSDPDADPLTFSAGSSSDKGGNVSMQSNGDFTYNPPSGYVGDDSFGFTVEDDRGGSDTATVSVTVNSAVSTEADSYTVTATEYAVTSDTGVLANDGSADSGGSTSGVQLIGSRFTAAAAQRNPRLQAAVVSRPQHGTLTLASDGSFEYRHDGSKSRHDSFTYRASDGRHESAVTSVTLAIDLPPVAQHGCWVTSRDRPLREQLQALVSGRPLFSIVMQPDRGSVALLDNTSGDFRYQPGLQADAAAGDRFAFAVVDHAGRSDDGAVDIIYEPRIMVLGAGLAAGLTHEATQMPAQAQRGGFRAPLQQLLTQHDYRAEFVGSVRAGGGLEAVDPDHEGHIGWSNEELAWGRIGYPHDGVRAWLDQARPDLVLLTAGDSGADTSASGMQALLNEIRLWAQTPGNHPVTLFVGTRLAPAPPEPGEETAAFNANLAAIVAAYDDPAIHLVALDAALRGPEGRPDEALYGDAHFPDAAGYQRLAAAWLTALRDTLDSDYRCPSASP